MKVKTGMYWVEVNHTTSTLSPVGPAAQAALLGHPDDTRKLAAQHRLRERAEAAAGLFGLPDNLYWEWSD